MRAVRARVRRVLVVDDDREAVKLFSRMLCTCDDTLEIVTASSGEQALAELRSELPDLMLLDLVMPDMDGRQVIECMYTDEEIAAVPTFIVSAQDPAEQEPTSDFLVATTGHALSLKTLLRCSLEISRLMLKPERELDLVLA
jgi:CheY-like chemotaxis protein